MPSNIIMYGLFVDLSTFDLDPFKVDGGSCMDIRLAYLSLSLIYYKGQGQCHVNFCNKYLGNDDRELIAFAMT